MALTNEQRAEFSKNHDTLASITEKLQIRVDEAKTNPAKVRDHIGASQMDKPQLKKALKKASLVGDIVHLA